MVKGKYRISANSFRVNYSFLNFTLCTVTFDRSTYRCRNYSREETIRGNTVGMNVKGDLYEKSVSLEAWKVEINFLWWSYVLNKWKMKLSELFFSLAK